MKNLNLFSKAVAPLLVALFLFSCSNTKGWIYKSNNYNQESRVSAYLKKSSIAVLPFADKRSDENKNYYMLYMLPLSPLGYQTLGSPETVAVHMNSGLWVNFNPKDDFAKAMVEELNSARVSKEAFFANSYKGSDYHIKGEIVSTEYRGKLFSYGLSVYGPLLWVVGLPATHVANDLEIRLSLIDTSSNKVVFSRSYKADHYSSIGWIYSLPNDFCYADMLAGLYRSFINDLENIK
jgi:hypothetical protein